jgi:hypothetical protein
VSPDYRTIFSGLVALESAALSASVATWGRLAEFALHGAGVTATTAYQSLRTPPGARQRAWEEAILRSWELDVDAARVIAGLPRLWVVLFLGELDRVRGPRPLLRASGPTGAAE